MESIASRPTTRYPQLYCQRRHQNIWGRGCYAQGEDLSQQIEPDFSTGGFNALWYSYLTILRSSNKLGLGIGRHSYLKSLPPQKLTLVSARTTWLSLSFFLKRSSIIPLSKWPRLRQRLSKIQCVESSPRSSSSARKSSRRQSSHHLLRQPSILSWSSSTGFHWATSLRPTSLICLSLECVFELI